MFSLPRLSPTTHRCAERFWAYPALVIVRVYYCVSAFCCFCPRLKQATATRTDRIAVLLLVRTHKHKVLLLVRTHKHKMQSRVSVAGVMLDYGERCRVGDNCQIYWAPKLERLPVQISCSPGAFLPLVMWRTRCRVPMLRLKTDSLRVCAR